MNASATRPAELLTRRQLEVLELVAKGLTNAEIAEVLGIAPATAKNHVAAVLDALDVTNRTEAVGLFRGTEDSPAHAVPGFGQRPAVALLALDNLGPPEEDYIADGLVEDLTTAMAAWRWFPVIARNSAFAFKGSGVDVREVSEKLGARYVVEGSARRSGDRLRVHVQLIDGRSGEHHWARRFDRAFEDLMSVQDEIVEEIVSALEPAIAGVERMRALRQPLENLDAWAWLQRGLHQLWQLQIGDPLAAEEHLRRAVDEAPDAAAGWAALAQCRSMWATWADCDDPLRWLADAEEAGRKAVNLDPMDYAGYLGLGAALALSGRTDEAVGLFRDATSLNPSSAQGWFGLATLSLAPGLQDEVVFHCERALRLSARDPMLHYFHGVQSAALLWGEDYEAALTAAQKSVSTQPSQAFSFRPLVAACLGHLGRLDEARAVRDEILAISPDFNLAPSRALAHGELVDRVAEGFARFDWHPD